MREIYSIASLHLAERFDLLFRFGREVSSSSRPKAKLDGRNGAHLGASAKRSRPARGGATNQKPSVADQSIRPTELAGLNLV